jgi:hypothetical protein
MNTRILIVAAATSLIAPFAFGQMYGGGYSQPQPQSQPQQTTTGGQQKTTTTTKTKTVMPQGVKGYLDSQMASSSDKKFHVSLNGKDLALSPTTFHSEAKLGGGKTSMAVDMKGADGKVYEIDFVTSNGQVSGAKVGKVNGKAP